MKTCQPLAYPCAFQFRECTETDLVEVLMPIDKAWEYDQMRGIDYVRICFDGNINTD